MWAETKRKKAADYYAQEGEKGRKEGRGRGRGERERGERGGGERGELIGRRRLLFPPSTLYCFLAARD